MHFDALTLACVTAELQQTVVGGRVQQVLMPDSVSIGFEIYANQQRHYLAAITEARKSRVQLAGQSCAAASNNQRRYCCCCVNMCGARCLPGLSSRSQQNGFSFYILIILSMAQPNS
jgi:hypothetical protein